MAVEEDEDDSNIGFFVRMPEDPEKRDEVVKLLAEIPLAYLAPEEIGFDDVVCEDCAIEAIDESIEDFNHRLGFNWCGKRIDGDPDGPNDPFFVIWAIDLTINQVEEIQKLLAVGKVWMEDWDEDDYHGEACIYECDQCGESCVSIDATALLPGINEGEIPDD